MLHSIQEWHKGDTLRLTISEEKVVGAWRVSQVGYSPQTCDRRGTRTSGSLRCLTPIANRGR